MSLVVWLGEALLILTVVLAVWNRIQERGRHHGRIAAMAAALAVGLHGLAAGPVTGTGLLGAIGVAALFVHAYLLLTLLGEVRRVPEPLTALAVVGAGGAVAVLFVEGMIVETMVTAATAGYLAVASAAVAYGMRLEMRDTGGVTAGRSRLIALGAAAFAVAFAAAGVRDLWGAMAWAADPAFQLLALGGAAAYLTGFAPPGWLADAWRLSEVGGFLSEVSRIRPEERPTDLFDELCDAAVRGVAGEAAYVAVPDADDATLHLQEGAGPSATFEDREGAVGRAWFRQHAVLETAAAGMEADERDLVERIGAGALIAVPVSSTERRRGVLVVLLDRVPLFPDADLQLLEEICRQAARALDNIEYSRDQERLVEKLRRTNEELLASRARIKESEERFRAVAETAADAVIVADGDGRIVQFNRAAEEIFGHASDDVVGEPLTVLMPERYREDHVHGLERFMETGKAQVVGRTVEMEGLRADGSEFPCELSVSTWEAGGGTYFAGILRDVTDQKEAERELREHREHLQELVEARTRELKEANAQLKREVQERIDVETELRRHRERLEELVDERTSELQEANERLQEEIEERERFEEELERRNRELEDFAYVVSHDLKEPLRGIRNLSEWIEEDLDEDLPAETRENLELLRNRVRRMGEMIDSILEYSRVGRVAAEPEEVDVGALLDDVVDLIDPPEGFEVVVDEMPTIVADRIRLQRVFQNLVANAVDHHDRDEGEIRVRATRRDGHVRFSVEDDGPGIPPDRRKEVFRIFRTLRPKDEHETTGVGLTLVKKIVETHGGEIEIGSPSGRGTRFEFTWPTTPRDADGGDGASG